MTEAFLSLQHWAEAVPDEAPAPNPEFPEQCRGTADAAWDWQPSANQSDEWGGRKAAIWVSPAETSVATQLEAAALAPSGAQTPVPPWSSGPSGAQPQDVWQPEAAAQLLAPAAPAANWSEPAFAWQPQAAACQPEAPVQFVAPGALQTPAASWPAAWQLPSAPVFVWAPGAVQAPAASWSEPALAWQPQAPAPVASEAAVAWAQPAANWHEPAVAWQPETQPVAFDAAVAWQPEAQPAANLHEPAVAWQPASAPDAWISEAGNSGAQQWNWPADASQPAAPAQASAGADAAQPPKRIKDNRERGGKNKDWYGELYRGFPRKQPK